MDKLYIMVEYPDTERFEGEKGCYMFWNMNNPDNNMEDKRLFVPIDVYERVIGKIIFVPVRTDIGFEELRNK